VITGCCGRFLVALGVALLCTEAGASRSFAQTMPGAPGFYLEAEGERVLGASDFEAGMVPTSIFAFTGPMASLDEGNGWGGALSLGYVWANGWSVAARYRRLEADVRGGPIDPGIVAFGPGVDVLPGGFFVGLLGARTKVQSETTIFDFEVGNDVAIGGAHLKLLGGFTYASIARDIAFLDDSCGCVPFSLLMANDFRGAGPKIGFRGTLPLFGGLNLVGGGSAAALFGTSKFTSRLDDPLVPSLEYSARSDRTVAALAADAGLALGVGPGTLTLGYRVDAMLSALDTDQRVSGLLRDVGFPTIGNRHDDFVEHGPFARLTVPFAGN